MELNCCLVFVRTCVIDFLVSYSLVFARTISRIYALFWLQNPRRMKNLGSSVFSRFGCSEPLLTCSLNWKAVCYWTLNLQYNSSSYRSSVSPVVRACAYPLHACLRNVCLCAFRQSTDDKSTARVTEPLLTVPAGSPSRGGDATVYVWHKPTELAHSSLFCSRVYFCLYGPFNCISFNKFSRQLSVFSLCSCGLSSALLVLSTLFISL